MDSINLPTNRTELPREHPSAPTRSDDQILPFVVWVPIRKSNHLDKNWFTLDANLLREALEITPIDQSHLFVSPPLGDAIMDFVNELGYLEEEFVQAMQTFLTDKANLGSLTKKGRKDKPRVIAYCRFMKLVICEVDEVFGMLIPNKLISNNIKNSPYYNAYLEMVAKHNQKIAVKKEGKKKSASTKQPKPKLAIEKSSKLAPAPKPKVTKEKPLKASTSKPPKPKPAKEKSTKATPLQKAGKGKVAKVRNIKSSFQLVDDPNEEPAQPEPEPEPEPEHQGKGEEYDMEHAIQMSLKSFQAQSQAHVGSVAIREPVAEATRPLPVVEGKGKAIVTKEQAAQSLRNPATEEASTGPSAQPQDDTSTNIVCDSLSLAIAGTGAES
ncbi:hypothetical protein Tco_0760821, partial [Tanacetum coccineum]